MGTIDDRVSGIGNRARGLAGKVGGYFRGIGRGLTSVVTSPRKALLATLAGVMIGGPGLEARAAEYDPAPKEPVAKKVPYDFSNNKPATQAASNITALEWNNIMVQTGNRSNTRDEVVQKVNWILANTDPKSVYYTTPGESASTTQDGINDTTHTVIYFNPGLYNNFSSVHEYYNLKPNKVYILDSATIQGIQGGTEHDCAFVVRNGGPVIVLGINDAKAENFRQIFVIGEQPYKNVLIEGLNVNFHELGVWMDNVKGSFSGAPVVLNLGEYVGGDESKKVVWFYQMNEPVDEESPNAAGYKLVLRNINCDAAIWDVPIYYEESLTMDEGGEWIALGNDEFSGIVTEGCSSFSLPDNIWIYNCPNDVVQKDLIEGATALVTWQEYPDWDGNPHVFDGENCFVSDSNDLYKDNNGRLYAVMFGRLHKQDGTYIADLEPVATIWSVGYFCNSWLAQGNPNDPNDPNNDSNYDGRADFDKNWIINFIDFTNVAEKYRSEGEPISKATIPQNRKQYHNLSGEMIEQLTNHNSKKQLSKNEYNNQSELKNHKLDIRDLLKHEQPNITSQNQRFAKYNVSHLCRSSLTVS